MLARFRFNGFAFLGLVLLAGCAALPDPVSYAPPVRDDSTMKEILRDAGVQYHQPALAAAVVHHGEIISRGAFGTTTEDGAIDIAARHRFHIGSTTKPLTALLVAILVEDGLLRYDTTLGEALSGVPMLHSYRSVTIHDLMLSRAGIIPFQRTDFEDPTDVEVLMEQIPARTEDPTEQRALVTEYALSLEPINEPGTVSVYSNTSWAIVGHVTEVIAEMPYEELLAKRVLEPLGMSGTRLGGWPASVEEPDQPRGHYVSADGPTLQPLDDPYRLPAWMNPAGGIHCTVDDYATLAQEFLNGLQGRSALLSRHGYATMHSVQGTEKYSVMYQGATQRGKVSFGYGWGVAEINGTHVSVADGSGGTFYARLVVIPTLDLAFAGFTNAGDGAEALGHVFRESTGIDSLF